MPVLTGSSSAELPFALERCWALVADIERAPDWQRTLRRVDVVERDTEGRVLVCDTLNDARLLKVRSRVRLTYEPLRVVRWAQISGDDLNSVDGSWELEPLGDELTRATYNLAIDPGPIGLLARPLERAIRPLVIGQQAGELEAALAADSR